MNKLLLAVMAALVFATPVLAADAGTPATTEAGKDVKKDEKKEEEKKTDGEATHQ